jgi:uncharacterized protein
MGCTFIEESIMRQRNKKIWIDLDNSPHVPFFKPIISELKKKKYEVILTARDAFQVVRLAELHGMIYKKCGIHYGKNIFMKILGLVIRTGQLLPFIVKNRPGFSVSHGSRSSIILSKLLRIPSLTIDDYEYSNTLIKGDWLLIPEIIPKNKFTIRPLRIFTYPGIKEHVYVPFFKPDDSIRDEFKFDENTIVVTIRPPATEAHYHNFESEELLQEVVRHVYKNDRAKIIMMVRNGKQKGKIAEMFAPSIASGAMMVPEKVFDGLNLIWYSDLIISGGGTMNREVAALHVPVYSIFKGTIGAVDRYLEKENLLCLVGTKEDIQKIQLRKRPRSLKPEDTAYSTLSSIIATIDGLVNTVYTQKALDAIP